MTLLASVNQVKAALRLSDTVDDSLIQLACEAASELVVTHCGRDFVASTGTRYYAAYEGCFLPVEDFTAVTEVATSSSLNSVYDITWTIATDLQLEPLNGRRNGRAVPYNALRAVGSRTFPYGYGIAAVKVTGTFGWAAVPAGVVQATVIQSARFFKRNDSVTGVLGNEATGLIRVGRSLDPDVELMLKDYVIDGGIGVA